VHLGHVQGPHPTASWRSGGYCVFCLHRVPSARISHTHPVFCKFFVYAYVSSCLCLRLRQGFYKTISKLEPARWEPALGQPLVVRAKYQLTASSQIIAEPLLFFHFILASIYPRGSPARLTSELLTVFLPAESFVFKEVVFDLSTDDLVSKHATDLIRFIKDLRR
jgi:hypothetical protein